MVRMAHNAILSYNNERHHPISPFVAYGTLCSSIARESALNKINWLKRLGPGFVTGAADDDPSGIATYSEAGAQFGFNTLWTVIFTYPLMVGIQLISARIDDAPCDQLGRYGELHGRPHGESHRLVRDLCNGFSGGCNDSRLKNLSLLSDGGGNLYKIEQSDPPNNVMSFFIIVGTEGLWIHLLELVISCLSLKITSTLGSYLLTRSAPVGIKWWKLRTVDMR